MTSHVPASLDPVRIAELLQRMHSVADRNLSRALRSQITPEDVVQSVIRSFFFRGDHRRPWSSEELLKALLHRTRCKCKKKHAQAHALRRDVRRVTASLDEVPAKDPNLGPEEEAVLKDLLACLYSKLSPEEIDILELYRSGYQTEEISEQLGVGERTVRRRREKAEKLLLAMLHPQDE